MRASGPGSWPGGSQSLNIAARSDLKRTRRNLSDLPRRATRPARQTLADPRRHRPRRAPQGPGQGRDRPRRRRAGLRYARPHPRGRHRGHQCGFTRYTNVDGIDELKDAIIAKFQRDNQLSYERPQILVSSGAKQTLYNLCMAVLDPGDEAVIPAPYWVSYPDMVLLADGLPVMPLAGMAQGYKITPRQLSAAITPKTKLVLLNSPCNPTGAAYTRAELRALGEVLIEHPRIIIGTDDMYEKIYWEPEPFCSLAQAVPELYPRTVTINGVSKAYAMTGWRLGYCGGPEGTHRGDGHHPGPVDVQRLEHLAEGGGRGSQRRPVVRHEDERGVQGTARLRRARAQLHPRRELPAGCRHLLCVRRRVARHGRARLP